MTMFKLDESIFSQRINDLKSTSDDFAKAKVAFGNLDISEMWTALSEVNKFSVPLGATMKVIDGELTNISQQYTEVIANLRIALEKSLGADDTHQGKYVHLLDTLAQASANFAYKTPEFLSRIKQAVHLGQSLMGGEGFERRPRLGKLAELCERPGFDVVGKFDAWRELDARRVLHVGGVFDVRRVFHVC